MSCLCSISPLFLHITWACSPLRKLLIPIPDWQVFKSPNTDPRFFFQMNKSFSYMKTTILLQICFRLNKLFVLVLSRKKKKKRGGTGLLSFLGTIFGTALSTSLLKIWCSYLNSLHHAWSSQHLRQKWGFSSLILDTIILLKQLYACDSSTSLSWVLISFITATLPLPFFGKPQI